MFTIRPSRQDMYANDPKFLWKYILRSLAIVLAIISIGLIGWSVAHQDDILIEIYDIYYYEYYGYYYWSYSISLLPWEFITLGLSVIWNVTNILVLLVRNKPIHPGANVACDLLLWLGLIVTGAFATAGAVPYFSWYRRDYDSFNEDTLSRRYANGPTYDILPSGTLSNTTASSYSISSSSTLCVGFTDCASWRREGVITAVGAVISFIVLLMHFALFISACRYTNARRVSANVALIAGERTCDKRKTMGGSHVDAGRDKNPNPNPNAAYVPISEPVEQQAPLDYGMPPAPTGITMGEKRAMRAVVSMQGEQGRKGTRHSYEQPEVVVHNVGGGEHTGSGHEGGINEV